MSNFVDIRKSLQFVVPVFDKPHRVIRNEIVEKNETEQRCDWCGGVVKKGAPARVVEIEVAGVGVKKFYYCFHCTALMAKSVENNDMAIYEEWRR